MTSVLIVDDHPVFRRGLAALLRAAGFDIVGEAAGSAEAIELVDRLAPEIVMMDLGLPDGSGVFTTERILAAEPAVRIVVLTMFDDEGSVRAALAAGASGYVVKDASADEIVAAVHAARMGATLIGSGVTRPADQPSPRPAAGPLEGFGLTPRELQLVDLISKGLPNRIIAERMGLTPKTVANYLSLVLVKLGAADRTEVAALVRRHRDG